MDVTIYCLSSVPKLKTHVEALLWTSKNDNQQFRAFQSMKTPFTATTTNVCSTTGSCLFV